VTNNANQALGRFDLEAYHRDGFTVIPSLFSQHELAPLIDHLRTGQAKHDTFGVPDQDGGTAELMVWSTCGNDLIGVLPRLARMVDIAGLAVGERVDHWHSKIVLKEPGRIGSWDWHQDYGHWYSEGCLAPQMMSIGVAIDPMHARNGPLKVVPGSHHLGRIDHIPIGKSNGADPQHVQRALERLGTYECHLATGDAIAFHANTLHSSAANTSDEPRSFLISSYNAASNRPWRPKISGHEGHDLDIVDGTAGLERLYEGISCTSELIQPGNTTIYGYADVRSR
jgi:ectoine hydroxylase